MFFFAAWSSSPSAALVATVYLTSIHRSILFCFSPFLVFHFVPFFFHSVSRRVLLFFAKPVYEIDFYYYFMLLLRLGFASFLFSSISKYSNSLNGKATRIDFTKCFAIHWRQIANEQQRPRWWRWMKYLFAFFCRDFANRFFYVCYQNGNKTRKSIWDLHNNLHLSRLKMS